ncbi:MAG: DUF460 domain-containing protein [Candidatus Aenigmatarchaeota archaeon]
MPKLIVGVDPGLRAGVAGVDIESRQVWFATLYAKSGSRSGIVDAISRRGEPVLFATDRARAPEAVRKIAAAFGCRVWAPRKDVSAREKAELTRGIRFRSRHERDALAAALIAYRRHSKLFEEIDAKLKKGMREIGADVKATVIRKRVSIAKAIRDAAALNDG